MYVYSVVLASASFHWFKQIKNFSMFSHLLFATFVVFLFLILLLKCVSNCVVGFEGENKLTICFASKATNNDSVANMMI